MAEGATDGSPSHDVRLPLVGAGAWAGGLCAYQLGAGGTLLAAGAGTALVGVLLAVPDVRRRPAGWRLLVAVLLSATAVAASVLLRQQATAAGPVPSLAEQRSWVTVVGTVTSDPRPTAGPWGERVVLRLRLDEVTVQDAAYRLRTTVVVLADSAWRGVALGERLRSEGRLAPSDDPDLGALLVSPSDPVHLRGPDLWWRASAAARAAVRDAVAHRPEVERSLVPALVDGDDAMLPPEVEQQFRTTGLTHLTAVSGTNLTLVVGFLLVVGRGVGVRGRWLHLLGLMGILGFVLLARTEPSVVRAAVMGAVGLLALGTDGRRRGLRALGVAVTVLLLVHPAFAVSAGFALSVLATAGIVLLAPPCTRALSRWLPHLLAQAVAVPMSAQLACTPLVAALSGEVSLVAVAANLAAAPAVGPATVLGLGAGMVHLVLPPLGRVLGTLAGRCVAWIASVAAWGSDLPGASISWGSGVAAIAALAALCLLLALLAPRVLALPWATATLTTAVLLVVVGLPGRIMTWAGSWPPDGWLLVACDVGQGDALALRTGPGSAVVVDAGPEPAPVDRCLDRLRVTTVPLVVLTHFHADHVDGLRGVIEGRRVGAIEVSPVLDPPASVEQVRETAASAGIPVAAASYGSTRTYGDATVQVLWPDVPAPVPGSGDGSSANDASVVLLVEVHGLRILLTGDLEPPGQARIAAAVPDLDVDVLKVPHHGSSYQDDAWLESLAPELAIVPVGEGNDYGHPAPELLHVLDEAGAEVARTDRDGAVAVVVDGGRPVLVSED